MKTINKFFMSVAALATMGLAACTGDLDQTPTDPNTITDGSEKLTAEKLMAGVMLNFAAPGVNGSGPISIDGGFGTFSRALLSLECISTDESYWYTGDADYSNFCYNQWTSENGIVKGCYNRLWVNIGVCNMFIETANGDQFANSDPARVAEFVRQCKILRGVCYYYLVDLYGNVPWAPYDMSIGTNDVPQEPRAVVFNNIVAELEEVVAEYGNNATQAYAYVGLEVAEAYLMKFYLNAEVYTGVSMLDKAAAYAERIIARHKGKGFVASDGTATGLVPCYSQLFSLDNKKLSNGGTGVNEIIWALPQDAEHLQSYANSTVLTCSWQAATTGYNITQSAWNCNAIRPEAAQQFAWKDANGNLTTNLNSAVTSDDTRTKWWGTTAAGCSYDSPLNYGSTNAKNGFAAIKYTNWYLDANGDPLPTGQPEPTTFVGADFAVVRLAEVYLSAAEAYFKMGRMADAVKYINYVRERAGISAVSSITSDDIFQERGRELYTENVRRTDMIRFGKWISGYNWAFKGGSETGANLPAGYELYPIPKSVLDLNPSYKQNFGYN